MDRLTTYVGQFIPEWAFSKPSQNDMTALAKICAALFGTGGAVNGLACTQTTVASMQVAIGQGELYQMAALEATVAGTLPADTTDTILKQGILLGSAAPYLVPASSTFAAPVTTGQSINYLIEGQYQDLDVSIDPTTGISPVVLPFYNSAAPASPLSGPNNSGSASNTFRKGVIAFQVKAGTAATTGTQVTPSVDSGWIGLYVVTVAYGQSTIINSNIALLATAPIVNSTVLGLTPTFSMPVLVGAATAAGHAVQLSQLNAATTGRLLNVQTITATQTYVPTAGTNSIIAEAWGGGAGGGGTSATGAGQVAIGGGGGAGAYAKGRFTSGITGLTATIGTGGTAGAGLNGGNGGTTSLGAILSAAGGAGGGNGGAVTFSSATSSIGSNGSNTTVGGNIETGAGGAGGIGLALSTGSVISSAGGSSKAGPGAPGSSGAAGQNATNIGSGGSGAAAGPSTAALSGGTGAIGKIVIYEYA